MVTPVGAPLTSGGSSTDFRFKLPDFSACTGDSANGMYRIQSYLVPQSVDLDTLRFDTSGPVPVNGQFRTVLYQSDSNPYVDQLTAQANPAPGPGPIIQPLPSFNFAVFDTVSFPVTPGVYNVGIACTLGPSSATQLDKYFNTVITITADPTDPGPADIRFVVGAVTPPTTTPPTTTPPTTTPPTTTPPTTTPPTTTPPTTTPDEQRCRMETVTIMGTPGNDDLVGTPGNDVISGLGGNDRIWGLGGDDVICGGAGDDRLIGGSGADVIIGGGGNDYISGDAGADLLIGGRGDDLIRGGRGDDTLDGKEGQDLCRAGAGRDILRNCEF